MIINIIRFVLLVLVLFACFAIMETYYKNKH